MITRRAMILGGFFMPVCAWAHEGHSHLPVTVSAEAVLRRSGAVEVTLTLFNSSTSDVILSSATVQNATVKSFSPFVVSAGGVSVYEITLTFAGATPGIFTLVLDFGDQGSGPVVVMI